ncbi:NADH dehydrogenase [Flagelloscypha sp. PMI_526]|nr:NADH dehydrogenase [Flagelloscypha sp. PMI_526]
MLLVTQSRLLRLNASILRRGQRAYHDLYINPKGQPIVSQGTPGYSGVSGHVVTVFGATGFLGRYVVQKLARIGTQVVIPYRDEDEKRHLKLMGDLGQIVNLDWDIRDEAQIAECLRHSDTVINLVGRDYETKNFTYEDASENGVASLIHVSHLNASKSSPSRFYRTKAEGEERVKAAFPSATILRPSTYFGYEDKLLNNIAIWPIWWKLNQGQTTMRPVHVFDVAQAIVNITRQGPPPVERPLNLPGPATYTHDWLLKMVEAVTLVTPSKAPEIPKRLAMLLGKISQAVWWPTLTPDEVERRFINDLDVNGDWDLLGIPPKELDADLAITYLRRYRSSYVRLPLSYPYSKVPRANLSRPVRLPAKEDLFVSFTLFFICSILY